MWLQGSSLKLSEILGGSGYTNCIERLVLSSSRMLEWSFEDLQQQPSLSVHSQWTRHQHEVFGAFEWPRLCTISQFQDDGQHKRLPKVAEIHYEHTNAECLALALLNMLRSWLFDTRSHLDSQCRIRLPLVSFQWETSIPWKQMHFLLWQKNWKAFEAELLSGTYQRCVWFLNHRILWQNYPQSSFHCLQNLHRTTTCSHHFLHLNSYPLTEPCECLDAFL